MWDHEWPYGHFPIVGSEMMLVSSSVVSAGLVFCAARRRAAISLRSACTSEKQQCGLPWVLFTTQNQLKYGLCRVHAPQRLTTLAYLIFGNNGGRSSCSARGSVGLFGRFCVAKIQCASTHTEWECDRNVLGVNFNELATKRIRCRATPTPVKIFAFCWWDTPRVKTVAELFLQIFRQHG